MRHIERNLKRNILRRADVKKRTSLSDATLWRYERDGKFPKRITISEGGAVGWFEDEIDQWIRDRVRSGGKRPPGVGAPRGCCSMSQLAERLPKPDAAPRGGSS